MKTIKNEMSNLINTALQKGYSKIAIEIIGTISCSDTTMSSGHNPLETLKLATEYVNKYDNEKDCICALIDVLK